MSRDLGWYFFKRNHMCDGIAMCPENWKYRMVFRALKFWQNSVSDWYTPRGCTANSLAAVPATVRLHPAASGTNERKAQREQARSIEGREASNLVAVVPFSLGVAHVYLSCHPCRYEKSHVFLRERVASSLVARGLPKDGKKRKRGEEKKASEKDRGRRLQSLR